MQTSPELDAEYLKDVEGKKCKWCGLDFIEKRGMLTVFTLANKQEHYHYECFTKTTFAKTWAAEFRQMRERMIANMTLEQRVNIVDGIFRQRGSYRISTKGTDDHFIRITITAKKLEFHRHDIQDAEWQAGLELAWIKYWNDPSFYEKHKKNLPKYMKKECDGKKITVMFVRDLR